ncbi:choice-of-anchor D domain-containing protein [Streptomyces gibsoniae]|uniref:Choice-of-anchor D domain-containing protein n=1 Tax=Streptomyces gibsoniae TaxID=3075529 RepID=A0ABU2U7L1_9ACTN|nr:choice-of-anchor D domain-containing protein [Streptomyces sp. DSM 41699]MDT0469220.1 choice-of-anchor D domain-containing protein [Streptomyces sp. DSM 41699]
MRDRKMIEFTADCGSGKTALLHSAAPDAYVRVGNTGLEDLLQDLVREFYVYPPGGRRLTGGECRRALEQVGAIVALDDVTYGREQITELQKALAGCAVLVGTGRPVIGRLGSSHVLPGLADPDAILLLGRDTGRFIPDEELAVARRLVNAVDGRPLAIRQAAALVRHDGRTLDDLVRQVESNPGVLDELAISALRPSAKRVLAVLALLGGALLPAPLVAAMAEVQFVAEEFEKLFARGLAERREDRFGLQVCKSESYRQILYLHLDLGSAMRTIASWITAADPSSDAARDAAKAALTLVEFAAERGNWRAILRLAAAAELVLFFQGHWQAWGEMVAYGMTAAHHAGDAAAEAYFSHQQGTLHFLEDRGEAARQALSHALELRTQMGDAAGAAVTRANLNFVTGSDPASGPGDSATGGSSGRSRRRTLVAAAAAIVILMLGVGIGVGLPGRGDGGLASSGNSTPSSLHSSGDGTSSTGSTGAFNSTGPERGSGNGGTDGTRTTGRTGKMGGKTKVKQKAALSIEGVGDYGDVRLGGEAHVTDFKISNPRSEPVTLDSITPPASPDFSLNTNTCVNDDGSALELAPGAACTVSVQFSPTSLGTRTDTFSVSYDGRTAPKALSGRPFATITVTSTSDSVDGSVDITADGSTVPCDPRQQPERACSVNYHDPQSPVVLHAYGNSNTAFGYWTGACQGTDSTCQPNVGGDISASFMLGPLGPRVH